jgi:hypothetical protein
MGMLLVSGGRGESKESFNAPSACVRAEKVVLPRIYLRARASWAVDVRPYTADNGNVKADEK